MARSLKRKTAAELPRDGKKKKQPQADEDSIVDGGTISKQGMGSSSHRGSGQEDEDENGDVEMNASGSEGEDEEWGGFGETGETENQEAKHGGGKPKQPPTGEEVREIKEATDLFRSSTFKLQIDALLPNVRPKESRKQPLERFLLVLHECLTSAPSVPPQHPLEAAGVLLNSEPTKLTKGKQTKDKGKAKAASVPIAVPYPLPLPTEDANWKVGFEAPTDILLVGSWANQVSVKAKDEEPWGIDLAVEMPATLFQEKDYMNGRFFHKRAFYLAALARHLSSQSNLNVDLLYESKNGDLRVTTLVLRPRNDGSPHDFTKVQAQVRIIPVLPSSSPIPLARLAPHRSNFRVHERSDASDAVDAPSSENRPTPLYNSAILLSATPKPHLLFVHALKQNAPAYTDALALLRIWANQRGYGEGKRPAVSGFEGRGQWWSALLEALVNGEELTDAGSKGSTKRKALGKGLSSYQLFKAALDFLARCDLTHERIFVKSKDGHRFPPQDYDAHHEVVFVDSSSLVNLLAGVPPSSLQMLGHDAKKTLQTLDNAPISDDPFSEVFLKEHRDLFTRFDVVLRVDLSTAKLRRSSMHTTLEHGSPAQALFASLDSVLRRGLGQRVKALCVLHPSSQPRPLSQADPATPAIVSIGLVFDTDHAFRLVDHGPAASETTSAAAEEFRDFWGDKAELRRFKDGSIVESVVWDVKNADERTFIPVMLVRHVLKRHLNVDANVVQAWQPAFDATLRLPESISSILPSNGIQAGFKAAMTAFDGLVKAIKALDKELPLGVLNVSPVSEYLRYTSVLSPTAIPASSLSLLPECGRYQPVMDMVLEFEKSARWPNDLEAIQKTKLAFLERLASALMASVQGTAARVVIGHSIGGPPICDQARLEIFTPQGWAFSTSIWHDREATLLDRIINQHASVPKSLQKPLEAGHAREREDALAARTVHLRQFVHAPRHHRAIAALSHQFPAFAGTVRLVKRWLAAHWLLRSHISEEAVELLCAHAFVGSGRARAGQSEEGVPASKERGFACVVAFLKDWDWTNGVFVPIHEDKDVGAGQESSRVVVTAGNKAVWTVATDFDREGHMWTAEGPDNVVANRVKSLAKATWSVLQQGVESGSLDVKALFVHPVDDYDFVVQMDVSVLPRYTQNILADPNVWARKGKYANLQRQSAAAAAAVPASRPGFDPAHMFLDDVKRVYADTLKIFYDPIGGDKFGAIWDPGLKQPRPFRVMNHFSSIPAAKDTEKAKDKDKATVVLNESAILSEILRLGSGIVKT